MRYLTLFLIPMILFSAGKEHQLEISFIRGTQAYQKGACDRTTEYFEDYIRQGGDRSRVIRLLAFCEVKQNRSASAITYLEEIFNNDNNDSDVAILLFKLYLTEKNYKQAKALAPMVGTFALKNPALNFWIGLLYFNLERYPEVLKYLDRFTPDLNNQDLYEKTLLIRGITYLQLKKTLLARKTLKKLLLVRELSAGTKEEATKALAVTTQLLQKKGNKSVLVTLTERLLFDSNVTSQPPFSDHYESELSGAPEVYSSDLTSMAVRNELEINLTWRAIQSKKHQLFVGNTIFAGTHFPYVIDDLFDPQEYDTLLNSLMVGYEFSHQFSRNNVLKLGVLLFENITFFNMFNDFTYYSRGENLYTYLYFTETQRLATRLSLLARNFTSEINPATPEEELTGYYLKPELEQSFMVNEGFTFSLSGGYIYDRTDGIYYRNTGFSVTTALDFRLFSFLYVNLNASLNKLWYEPYNDDDSSEQIERLDTTLVGAATVRFVVSKLFHFGLQYRYTTNDSNNDDFVFDKHVGGFFFNLFF